METQTFSLLFEPLWYVYYLILYLTLKLKIYTSDNMFGSLI